MRTDGCKPEYSQLISDCYDNSPFALNDLPFRDNFPSFFVNLTDLNEICDIRNQLNNCIGPVAKNNCMNVKDFEEISFRKEQNAEKNGKNALINFLQLDYICTEAVNVLREQHICIGIQGADSSCTPDSSTCASVQGHAACVSNVIEQRCGPAAGCFAKKFTTLQVCYDADRECANCYDISKDIMNGLCDADTKNNGNSLVLGFVLITILLLSF
uniref:ShKT domain-containing protein n=1 Tax=Panagrolaimus superbus TaxID=310955 RepID=A0A914XWB7_9BILA